MGILVAVSCKFGGARAAENWMFATPEPLPEPVNLPGTLSITPSLSADGLTLYFASDRPGGHGATDIWRTERPSADEVWNTPVNLGAPINTTGPEAMPFITPDGLALYFSDANILNLPPRPGGPGDYQIWVATRQVKEGTWDAPTDLKAPVGSSSSEQYPHLSGDGLSLYYVTRQRALDGLVVSRRSAVTEPWLAPAKLDAIVTQSGYTGFPYLSASGLHLLFYSDRSGGRGSFDLWMTTRATPNHRWTAPANLGSRVNTGNIEMSPCVSSDFPALGSYLLFARNDNSAWNNRFKLYRAAVVPSMTVFRAPTVEGPWTVADATVVPRSGQSFESEVTVGTPFSTSFYRLSLNGQPGALRITFSEGVGNKLRVRYDWVKVDSDSRF